MNTKALPPHAFAAALASLPAAGPARLRALLQAFSPGEAWAKVLAGHAVRHPLVAHACRPAVEDVSRLWRGAAARLRPGDLLAANDAARVRVWLPGDAEYPTPLLMDHERPEVLFARAAISTAQWTTRRRVAIVGTRRCTGYGRDVAFDLGRDLAAAGVVVVSGLALGVDGAAHAGAVEAGHRGGAPPVAVVGSGLDVVYPSRHRELWNAVASAGALLTEATLGARPEPWRFPARNRIVAALADVVVVVESRTAGGSNHTVESAIQRSVPVMAVPGPIRSDASGGTNRLIAEGCAPVTHVDDVLAAIDLSSSSPASAVAPAPPDAGSAAVLEVLEWTSISFDAVVERSGMAPAAAALALAKLEAAGLARTAGGWWERCDIGN